MLLITNKHMKISYFTCVSISSVTDSADIFSQPAACRQLSLGGLTFGQWLGIMACIY